MIDDYIFWPPNSDKCGAGALQRNESGQWTDCELVFSLLEALDSLLLSPEATSIMAEVQASMQKNLYWAIIRMSIFALREAKMREDLLVSEGTLSGTSAPLASSSSSNFEIGSAEDDDDDTFDGVVEIGASSSRTRRGSQVEVSSPLWQFNKLHQCYEKNVPRLQMAVARMLAQSTSDDNVRMTCWTLTFFISVLNKAEETQGLMPVPFVQALRELLRTQREPIERLLQESFPQEHIESLEEVADLASFYSYLAALRDRFTLLYKLSEAKNAVDNIIDSLSSVVTQRRDTAIQGATTTVQAQSKVDFSKVRSYDWPRVERQFRKSSSDCPLYSHRNATSRLLVPIRIKSAAMLRSIDVPCGSSSRPRR